MTKAWVFIGQYNCACFDKVAGSKSVSGTEKDSKLQACVLSGIISFQGRNIFPHC